MLGKSSSRRDSFAGTAFCDRARQLGRLNAARAREQFSEQALLDRTIAAISPYLPGERSASSVR
jgi:hypothetical protein